MKKSDLKEWMIVETGCGNEKYIIMSGKVVDDELNGYSLDDFDDDLINKIHKPESISKVYEPVKAIFPFELDIEKMFTEQKPELLWKRQPTKLSKDIMKKLQNMDEKQGKLFLDRFVFPIIFVD